MTGQLVAISISEKKGIRKSNVPSAHLVEGHGIEGDAHAGPWHRQVSLLARESIDKMTETGLDVGPGAFAENLTTSGIDLLKLKIGDRLRIGEAELEITQIGKECHNRCAIYDEAGDCVMPREGIFARVLRGAEIIVGDVVSTI
ncbi:MAG TPA: MOSC domain-containing protein [Acidobacteriota bacterium]|nr:MOSC domain-containing protein [Acidobacteriota bacterium]